MKCNFINISLKDKNNINLNDKILELFKLSIGNSITNMIYNKKKKEDLNQNLEIIYYKKYMKKNIGKMIYKNAENKKIIKVLNIDFISKNIKRAKIILNNKQYGLKENIGNTKQIFKIKIKFLDNVIYSNSMFENCESLSSIYNFQNFNTKYLKTIYNLFYGCNSLLYIDNISNWNINNINNMSNIFNQCSLLETMPDISKWNTNNIIDMNNLFCCYSSLKYLPDISKWNIYNVYNIEGMFSGCSSLEEIPDISKMEHKTS